MNKSLKNTLKILTLPLIFSVLTFMGCDKNGVTPAKPNVIIDNSTSGSPVIINNIDEKLFTPDFAQGQEYFDWQNLTNLPLPPTSKSIPMPWNSKAKTAFSDDIRNDYKKTDGWELYISTFSPKLTTDVKSFILYNKWRGTLRYYYFLIMPPADVITYKDYSILSQNVLVDGQHASQSPLLNFSHQSVVDVTKNSTRATTLEPQSIADSVWFAWEYELAFDKNTYDQNANTFLLSLGYSMLKKELLFINDQQQSTLQAKIRLTDSQYSFGQFYSGDAAFIFYGINDLNKASGLISSSSFNILKQLYFTLNFNQLLNGVVGGNSIGQVVWNGKVDILTQSNALGLPGSSFSTVISGADNSSMQGLAPFYNRALGVFYLNTNPKVNLTKSADNKYIYVLDVPSVQYLFNPAVTESASIANLIQEILGSQDAGTSLSDENKDIFIGQKFTSDVPLNILGVRVSFDVVPTNGAKPIHLVKLFKAEVVSGL